MVPITADTTPTVPLMIRLFRSACPNFGSAIISAHQRRDSASIGKADWARLLKENRTTSARGDSRNTTNNAPTPRQTILDVRFIAAAIAPAGTGTPGSQAARSQG